MSFIGIPADFLRVPIGPPYDAGHAFRALRRKHLQEPPLTAGQDVPSEDPAPDQKLEQRQAGRDRPCGYLPSCRHRCANRRRCSPCTSGRTKTLPLS